VRGVVGCFDLHDNWDFHSRRLPTINSQVCTSFSGGL
jgi:hypothetical protein